MKIQFQKKKWLFYEGEEITGTLDHMSSCPNDMKSEPIRTSGKIFFIENLFCRSNINFMIKPVKFMDINSHVLIFGEHGVSGVLVSLIV